MGSLASSQVSGVTLGALGARKLRALAAALELSDALTAQALDVFSLMGASWADWAVGDVPVWPNDISDDGTPFEFSASFDGAAPRLRMLVESQAEPISRTSSWGAGLALGERLRSAGLADLTLFDQIRDLFVPHSGAQGRFSLWHAAVVEQGQPALFKAYVNPCSFGMGSAPYVVEQALRRLGFEDAWRFVKDRLASDTNAEIRYFSVDLEAPESARVKVYVGCSQSAAAVDRLIESARNHESRDAQQWLATLTASQGPFDARPILNCFSFRRERATPDVTVHVPIRCYVKHDAEALARVSELLTAKDADRLSRALSAVSERPLNVGRGLLTYASIRREAEATRVTVYLAPEAYSITSRRPSVPPPSSGFGSGVHKTSPRTLAPSSRMADAQALIARHCDLLRAQPFLEHLAGTGTLAQAEQVSSHLSLVVLWLGDLFRFAEERASDPEIRAHLASQSAAAASRASRFRSELQALGLLPASVSLYTEGHALIREVAFACVADVISTGEDRVRLGMVLSASATCDLLLKAGIAFASRVTGHEGAADSAHSDAVCAPELAEIRLLDAVASEVYAAVDRCFNSVLRVVGAIDHATFGASNDVATL
jgi:DMATS type aromatic prenyltransferase